MDDGSEFQKADAEIMQLGNDKSPAQSVIKNTINKWH